MRGVIPGQEAGILFVVLVIFIPLIIYLCIKFRIRQTLSLLTIGLWR